MASEIQVDTQFYVTEIDVEETSEDLLYEQTIAEIDITGSGTELVDAVEASIDVTVIDSEAVVDVITEGVMVTASQAMTTTGTASTNLSGHRVVADLQALVYATNTDPAFGRSWLYITQGAISSGASAQVVSQGLITESSWSWTPGETLYLSSNGFMSHTAPTTGFSRIVGWAETATTIYFEPQMAVFLS